MTPNSSRPRRALRRGAPRDGRTRTPRSPWPSTPWPSKPAGRRRRAATRTPRAAASTSSGCRITRPVSPSDTASAAPPDVTGHLRHAARRGLDEHDAETLLLETAPPIAAQHREHVGAPVERRQLVVRHTTEEPHRCVQFAGEPLEASSVAAATGDRQHQIGSASGPTWPPHGSRCRTPCEARAARSTRSVRPSAGSP